MRVTVVYEDIRVALDLKPNDTVANLKRLFNSKIILETTEDKKVGKYLELKFGGAPLDDKWVLQDIGITSGSNVKAALKIVEKPKLIINLAYNQETLLIMEDIDPISITVGEVSSMIASRLGIPISIFRLSFVANPDNGTANSANPDNGTANSANMNGNRARTRSARRGKELYNTNTLDYYGIDIGSRITLDLWDGWNEVVLSAVAGHENMVTQYFSWDKSVRAFQQRAALYIAAYYGHMGLATAMMKRGARGHEPVGIHPFRKWCFESEHPETKRCPLHVACSKGHLPILRLFVKSSPLCFITKDEHGLTPLQMVLRHRHRACFEFLIARQWGRKTGKDFTFSMTIYCKILRWCERAKMQALLMHGTEKSTFKGLPQKEGALVGTSVLVDGFSKKPANSVPYALVPKPAIPAEKMIYALSMTKRKLRAIRRRQSNSRIVSRRSSTMSMTSSRKRDRNSSATSTYSSRSSFSLDKLSLPVEIANNNTKYTNQLSSNGNLKTRRKPQSSNLASKSNAFATRSKELNLISATYSNVTKSAPQLDAITEQTKTVTTTGLPLLSEMTLSPKENRSKFTRKDSRISFKTEVSQRNANTRQFQSFAAIRPTRFHPSPAVKKPPAPFHIKVPEKTGIPLPAKSQESQLKPFFYWSPYEKTQNPVDVTLNRFQAYRGVTPREHAVECLSVTSSFTEKPWLEQLRMAVCLTKRGVKKNYDSHAIVAG